MTVLGGGGILRYAAALQITAARLKLILDTNVVLDWLVFHDARVAGLQPAFDRKQVELVSHKPAVHELRRVLAYEQFKLTSERQQAILAHYSSLAHVVTSPSSTMPPDFPRCSDPDDQHFLELAYQQRVDGLVSKDKAILGLTKRLRKFGVTVLDPKQLTEKLLLTP